MQLRASKHLIRVEFSREHQRASVRLWWRLSGSNCALIAYGIGHRLVVDTGQQLAGEGKSFSFRYHASQLIVLHAVGVVGLPAAISDASEEFANVKTLKRRTQLPVRERLRAVLAPGKLRVEDSLGLVAESAAADAVLGDEHWTLFFADDREDR